MICLDGWSKKGLSCHFLGISACFFDPVSSLVCHVVLTLTMIRHFHTGEKLAAALNDCLVDWGIEAGKVMMIISDNGSNMIKAIQLLKDMNVDDARSDDGTGSDDEASEDEQADELTELPHEVLYRRMPCMAHYLQLVIKKVYGQHYEQLLAKTRQLVNKIRKSSHVVQKLAYVERIFSVCGIMSSGNQNCMSKSFEMRVCLKQNNNVLKLSGFQHY